MPADRVLVEVTVDSVAGAVAAANAGADRLELAVALGEGGLTPGPGLAAAVCAAVDIPVMVLLRPRGGDFLYDASELAILRSDLAWLRGVGVQGFVFGALQPDGSIDRNLVQQMVAAAAPLPLVFHRAFDLCADPLVALATLRELGVARVLTSGQAASAPAGAALLRELVRRAAGQPTILAGAGIKPENARELVLATGCRELHLSATGWLPSAMQFRRPSVAMGAHSGAEEYRRRITDPAVVAAVVRAVRAAAPGSGC